MKATLKELRCLWDSLNRGIESERRVWDVVDQRLRSVRVRPGQKWIGMPMTREQMATLGRLGGNKQCFKAERLAEEGISR
jgi:hypothetical protein